MVTLAELVTPADVTIDRRARAEQAQAKMAEVGVRYLAVMDRHDLVGVIGADDLARLDPDGVRRRTVGELMSIDLLTVALTETVDQVAARMGQRRCPAALVVHQARVVGIFTAGDALAGMARQTTVGRRPSSVPRLPDR